MQRGIHAGLLPELALSCGNLAGGCADDACLLPCAARRYQQVNPCDTPRLRC